MSGIPYEGGQPLRCSVCRSIGSIRILVSGRPQGPYCRTHMPVSPTIPSWGVGHCRKCTAKGARIVTRTGKITGPWCADHRPPGQAFGEQSDRMLEQLVANVESPRIRRWSE